MSFFFFLNELIQQKILFFFFFCVFQMELSREIYFIFFGGLITFFLDLYFSLTSSTLLVFAFIRILTLLFAFFYRIIREKDDKRNQINPRTIFWNRLKNIFVIIAAIEQAYVIYYLNFSWNNIWSILHLIEQVSMPLIAYLWIRRVERANFTVLQHAWWEIIESKITTG